MRYLGNHLGWLACCILASAGLGQLGCSGLNDQASQSDLGIGQAGLTSKPLRPNAAWTHPTTRAIDRYDAVLGMLQPRGHKLLDIAEPGTEEASTQKAQAVALKNQRLSVYRKRWAAVQNAVAYRAAMHRDGFYTSRLGWHRAAASGGLTSDWTLDHRDDLRQAPRLRSVSRGKARVQGDMRTELVPPRNAVVHIYGDLDAPLRLSGVCEVVIGGRVTSRGRVICEGQLELFVGGDFAGELRVTRSATAVIDGNAAGAVYCGAPATRLTVTGDWSGKLWPAKTAQRNAEAAEHNNQQQGPAGTAANRGGQGLLTLCVEGFCAGAVMQDAAAGGFARVEAVLGASDWPAGLHAGASPPGLVRPRVRWTVLRQSDGPAVKPGQANTPVLSP